MHGLAFAPIEKVTDNLTTASDGDSRAWVKESASRAGEAAVATIPNTVREIEGRE
jgi:hypothetical protein